MNKLLVVILLICVAFLAGCGQSPVASTSGGSSGGATAGSWEALAGGMDKPVSSIAFDKDGVLYAGGSFVKAGGVSVNYVTKWDGSKWVSLAGGTNGVVNTIAADNLGNVYAGGNFTVAGGVAVKNFARWSTLTSTWDPIGDPGGQVTKIFLLGPHIYVIVDGANYIKKWDGSAWQKEAGEFDSPVYDFAVSSTGTIYAGGAMLNDMTGTNLNKIAVWKGSSWEALAGGANDYVNRVMLSGSNLYAGGAFTSIGGIPAAKIAKWTGSTWEAMGSGVDNSVYALTADAAGNIYAGGMFDNAGSVEAKKLAKWDGTSWSEVGGGFDEKTDSNKVNCIAFDSSGKLYVAGDFYKAGGLTVNYIAKLK